MLPLRQLLLHGEVRMNTSAVWDILLRLVAGEITEDQAEDILPAWTFSMCLGGALATEKVEREPPYCVRTCLLRTEIDSSCLLEAEESEFIRYPLGYCQWCGYPEMGNAPECPRCGGS
jgi:hypothetical protein